jgi:REP element-mobilizing transposase RayT
VYHVYARIARGEHVFRDESEAWRLLARIASTKKRDDFVVMAYCVMSNHYHLAIRMGEVPLSRSMWTIHQRFTQSYNGRRQVLGPLWQGRYKSKLVETGDQLRRLVLYIHLNPVTAGIVRDPGDYRFSGHGELVAPGRKQGLVDVDEALAVFGAGRREALQSYGLSISAATGEEWLAGEPGHLPWWRLGRPRSKLVDEPLELDDDRPRIGLDGLSTVRERPELEVDAFLERGAAALGQTVAELVGRSREARLVESRQILTMVAVERYGFLVKAMAAAFDRYVETASRWISRGMERREVDADFRQRVIDVDRAIASAQGR